MANRNHRLKGTGVALITPFQKNGSIDFNALNKVINHVINGGVDYVVSLGTTGETPALSKDEKQELISYTVEKVNKRIPVVVGMGGSNTSEIVKSFAEYNLKGVEAILSVSPYYNKPSQKGLVAHYKAIASESPLPIILYNVPSRTASNISAETTLFLANEVENIIGIKEASGSFDQIMKIIKYKPKDFLLISGDDLIAMPIIAAGGDGVISVIANAFPKDFSEIITESLNGDYSKARRLQYKIDEFIRLIFADGNPAGIKYIMEELGLCSSYLRLPLVDINDEVKKMINKELMSLQIIK